MIYLERTQQLYRDYMAEVARVRQRQREKGGLSGLFGFLRPDQDPCHERFVEDLTAVLELAAREGASPEETRELLHFIYRESGSYENDKVLYWMLLAAHALTRPLLPLLDPADAAELAAWYAKKHPKSGLLPNQKILLTELRQRAENA